MHAAEPIPTDPAQPVYIAARSIRNPAAKARNVRYRVAAALGWSCSVSLTRDRIIVSGAEMREALRFAGQLCGLGTGRSSGFGRFTVEGSEVVEA